MLIVIRKYKNIFSYFDFFKINERIDSQAPVTNFIFLSYTHLGKALLITIRQKNIQNLYRPTFQE